MTKRVKRVEKGIESLKKEIEEHFRKLDEDILQEDKETARYHIKEIDRSFITTLTKKMALLEKGEISEDNLRLLDSLRKRLQEYQKIIGEQE